MGILAITETGTIGGIVAIFVILITVILWVVNRVPDKNKVVYKDTCQSDQQAMKNCVEGAINLLNQKVDLYQKFMGEKIQELKDIICKDGGGKEAT